MSRGPDSAAALAALVEQLERLSEAPSELDLEALSSLVSRRQTVLDQLSNADMTWLEPESRRELFARIEAVRHRDHRLVEVLRAEAERLQDRLQDTTRARVAARGYRAAAGPDERHEGRKV